MSIIGIDYSSAIYQSAGIGRYTREMVKALATLSQKEQYRLFVAGANNSFIMPPPAPNFQWATTRLTERWLSRLWYRMHLPLWIESWTGRLDLFHAPDFFLPPTLPTTRTIVTIHDLSFIREPETVMPGMKAHLNNYVPRSVKRADHIIAVSESTRQDLIELYGTPPEKISTLYHGVTANFRPIDGDKLPAVREKYGLGHNPFILSVGSIQPRKNYKRLIQAFAQISPPFSLVIAGGKGWLYDDIFAETLKQGLRERVFFPGFVADDDLPALYNAASLFVYPSLHEGFGLPLLEAMACGTPVISSNRSSLPEVVGDAGLLVDPYDIEALASEISRLLSNTELMRQLSRDGQAQAAKFSWEGMADKLLKLYQRIIEEGK